ALDNMMRDARAQRISTKRRAMVARHNLARNKVVRQRRSHGETIAQSLGCGDDVRMRFSGQRSVGPEGAGSAKTALDLIVDEHWAERPAGAPGGGKEGRCGDVDAAFALDGLDEHAGCA